MTYDPGTPPNPWQPQQSGQPTNPTGVQPYQPFMPPAPLQKKSNVGLIIGIVAGVLVLLCGGTVALAAIASSTDSGGGHGAPVAAAGGHTSPTAAPEAAAADADSPEPKPSPTPPKPKRLLKVSGTGIKKTAKFTTDDEWTMTYSYNCSNFYGGKGNFQVYEYSDGSFTDVLTNELGKKGSDTVPQHDDPGEHYLEINSECKWTVAVTG